MDSRRSKTGSKKTVNKGIYILEIFASESFRVGIKKFQEFSFKKGYYYYVGSAQKNLRQRLARHVKKEKLIHWHIDHITTKDINNIKAIYVLKGSNKKLECKLANTLENKLKLDSSIKGFGNSDSNCSSTHLFYSKQKIDYNHLFSLYQSMARLIPSEIDTF